MTYRISCPRFHRRGFSLIEILAVLAVVSLLTAVVSVRWSSVYREAVAASTVTRLKEFDAKTRLHLLDRRKSGKIIYDLNSHTVKGSRWSGTSEKSIGFHLPATVRLIDSRGTTVDGNRWTINIREDASAETYAIKLRQFKKVFWIVFVGQTGQVIQTELENELNDFF